MPSNGKLCFVGTARNGSAGFVHLTSWASLDELERDFGAAEVPSSKYVRGKQQHNLVWVWNKAHWCPLEHRQNLIHCLLGSMLTMINDIIGPLQHRRVAASMCCEFRTRYAPGIWEWKPPVLCT